MKIFTTACFLSTCAIAVAVAIETKSTTLRGGRTNEETPSLHIHREEESRLEGGLARSLIGATSTSNLVNHDHGLGHAPAVRNVPVSSRADDAPGNGDGVKTEKENETTIKGAEIYKVGKGAKIYKGDRFSKGDKKLTNKLTKGDLHSSTGVDQYPGDFYSQEGDTKYSYKNGKSRKDGKPDKKSYNDKKESKNKLVKSDGRRKAI